MAKRQFDQERNRLEYGQLLFPEPGYELDFAVGMTYSLDFEALLGVPVSLGMLETLDSAAAQNPYFLLEAIRKSSDRIALFCNYDGIKLPQNIRPVYALLENSVFPVFLGTKKNFHPKLWVIRYKDWEGNVLIRVIVLSRNLTFDRSMDIAVEMTGEVGKQTNEVNRPLSDMLSFVADYASEEKRHQVKALARDVMRVGTFDCDEKYEEYQFLPFGIPKYKNKAQPLFDDANQLLVVSPFLSDGVLKTLTDGPSKKVLITRSSSITRTAFFKFEQIYVPKEALLDNAVLEQADEPGEMKRDLHAKVYFKTCREGNFLYLGSLNASANAFYHNVEFMLGLKFRPYMASFDSVLKDFVPDENSPFELVERLDHYQAETEGEEDSNPFEGIVDKIRGAVVTPQGDGFRVQIDCDLPEREASIEPLFRRGYRRPLAPGVAFDNMLLKELSELYVISCDGVCGVVKIPTTGIPLEERNKAIYSNVIGSKSGFLAYVSFLLSDDYTQAGMEQHELLNMLNHADQNRKAEVAGALYERLLWTAAYQPERFESVQNVMQHIEPELVDESFKKLVELFQQAISKRKKA